MGMEGWIWSRISFVWFNRSSISRRVSVWIGSLEGLKHVCSSIIPFESICSTSTGFIADSIGSAEGSSFIGFVSNLGSLGSSNSDSLAAFSFAFASFNSSLYSISLSLICLVSWEIFSWISASLCSTALLSASFCTSEASQVPASFTAISPVTIPARSDNLRAMVSTLLLISPSLDTFIKELMVTCSEESTIPLVMSTEPLIYRFNTQMKKVTRPDTSKFLSLFSK